MRTRSLIKAVVQVSGFSRILCWVVMVACIGQMVGCAFIPTPVRLLNKPHSVDKQADEKPSVFIIVRDERPQSIQKSNMCGLMRNGYMIPTSFAFLAHVEHLDAITAYHLKRNLENLGYRVIGTDPRAPDELSSEELKANQIDKEAKKAAWWTDSKSQDDPDSKKKGLLGGVEALEDAAVSPWGVDTSEAHVVIEVKIRKFWSDCNYLGVFAWMSTNIAACNPADAERKVIFGRKVRGFGYGTGISPVESYNMAVNVAYWFVLHQVEKTLASSDFQEAVVEIDAGRVGNER